MDRLLTYSDLPVCTQNAEAETTTPELREALDRHARAFMTDEEPEPIGAVVMFRANAPGCDRALLAHVSHLHGTPEENLASIKETAPKGCFADALVRIL